MRGLLVATAAGVLLAACSSSRTTTTAEVEGAGVTTTAQSGTLAAPGVMLGGAVVSGQIQVPDPAQAWYGAWTLARAGDRVCTVQLAGRNAAGEYVAKTRNCVSVELARIAVWAPTADGILLYDFERRPVVTFRRAGPALYEGNLGDVRVTLWR